MSDLVVREASPSTAQPEFHPVRDLIDNIRQAREERKQARHERKEERKEQAQLARNMRHGHVQPSVQPHADAPGPVMRTDNIIRTGGTSDSNPAPAPRDNIARPMPVGTPSPYIGTRGQTNMEYPQAAVKPYYASPQTLTRFAAYETSAEPSQAKPESNDGGANNSPEQIQEPRITERILPDTITVKERNGAVAQIPEQRNACADERLGNYLQKSGSELTQLDLNGSSVSDKGLGLLSKAPNLTKLWLNDTEVNNDSMKVLAQQGLKNLQDLNLHSTRVGDEGLAQLKDLPLKVLNMADTATSDDCYQHLKAMKSLQVLNADYSGLGNESVKAFKEMANLRSVSLKGCPITDDCIKDLSQCNNLMLLNLEDTKLSSAKVTWLQRQMPRTLIIPPDGQGAAQGQHQEQEPKHGGLFKRLFDTKPRR